MFKRTKTIRGLYGICQLLLLLFQASVSFLYAFEKLTAPLGGMNVSFLKG